jgi:hypothetical protein
MARLSSLIIVLSAWFISSSAQFGFFDQMFGQQGHQQHQEPQNVRSDSSWYQAQYEGGMFSNFNPHPIPLLVLRRVNGNQHNAHTTSVPARCPACTSHTTVPARGRASKIKLNWEMALRSVGVKADGRMGSLGGRWSWRGRVCCEAQPIAADTLERTSELALRKICRRFENSVRALRQLKGGRIYHETTIESKRIEHLIREHI